MRNSFKEIEEKLFRSVRKDIDKPRERTIVEALEEALDLVSEDTKEEGDEWI